MKKIVLITAALAALLAGPSLAQNTEEAAASAITVSAGESFVKKRYSIKGGWEIAKENGQTVIRFDEDFKTKSGPDLKVYLSKTPLSDLDGARVGTDGVKIAVLQSNRGQQSYILPDDIDISSFKSVVIHCEAYSVLWGGFDIAEAVSAP